MQGLSNDNTQQGASGYWLIDLHIILDWAGDFALGIAVHASMAV